MSDIRRRTTVHFAAYQDDAVFIGARPATALLPDVTVELSARIPRAARLAKRVFG